MTWLFIESTDVWFFRDGRPFPAGGGYTARGMFPPSPLTVQGAIRSFILGRTSVDWDDFRNQSGPGVAEVTAQIGSPTELGAFSMKGPFLARQNTDGQVERLVPMPVDAFVGQRDAQGCETSYAAFQPTRQVNYEANWPATDVFPLWPADGVRKDAPQDGLWLSNSALNDYLNDEEFGALHEPLFQREPRLGIALDYGRRRPAESMIYQTEFVRLKDAPGKTGLLVWLDPAIKIPMTGWLALGGQARSAHYQVLNETQIEAMAILREPTCQIKAVLLTPAYFDGGWRPSDGNWSKLLGQPARLISAALGRPMFLGGWNIATRGHKDMQAYVPPGSVYFFEVRSPVRSLSGALTQTPSGTLQHDQLGFGQVAAGAWKWLD